MIAAASQRDQRVTPLRSMYTVVNRTWRVLHFNEMCLRNATKMRAPTAIFYYTTTLRLTDESASRIHIEGSSSLPASTIDDDLSSIFNLTLLPLLIHFPSDTSSLFNFSL